MSDSRAKAREEARALFAEVFPAPRYGRRNIAWDALPLGLMTDADLAAYLDVTDSAVLQARRKRGIAAFRSGGPKSIDWCTQPLGETLDRELALVLGVTTSAVQKARSRRGITAARFKAHARTLRPQAKQLLTAPPEGVARRITTAAVEDEGSGAGGARPRKAVRQGRSS